MELQPVLLGETLELRPLKPEHWPELFAAASDPLIWAGHPNHDRWKEDVFKGFFEGALASGGGLAILERSSGRIVGSSRYHGHDAAKSEVEIGWTFLIRRLWGGRANAELKGLMVGHAFKFVRRVVFLVDEKNLRSRRAMEKIGGRLAESFPRGGRVILIYELVRPG